MTCSPVTANRVVHFYRKQERGKIFPSFEGIKKNILVKYLKNVINSTYHPDLMLNHSTKFNKRIPYIFF